MSDYVKKRITDLFAEGKFLCAESVLKVISEAGGKDSDDFIRMATGFCSGAARTKGQCGAVSGAIMGIGLFAGRSRIDGDYEAAYALTQEFITRFAERFDSLNCFELIGCDFATHEGKVRFKKENLRRKCHEYSTFAVEMSLELLRENGYVPSHEDFIKSRLAPCGLSCGKCLAYADGSIRQLSAGLASELGDNFGVYAQRFAGMNPVFREYASFRKLLDYLSQGTCTGCRETGCLFKDCKVPSCVRENGVDYCHQCGEFPCDRHGMPDGLAPRWLVNNEKMRDIGVDAWFDGCREKPRYS
ncbi:C-GCAxxG-C-C family (seleno)protein [uncultured Pseudodesulfovibrio sp.]|uniref:C-GCAxxG-C-C family (seleno)protein n=1 Tax=uncultured Pseudodesulfovibrio sp. TaxID=2035858 RepID=UPI0029C70D2C|nr:C-GCAxxG-C-C family (seleno)protein [uncultured Pseudodesulfovibrio sp.]